MENRRKDRRLLLSDLQIDVKKQTLGDDASFIACTPVDISFNGLAFSSDQLVLKLLQKVDIQLSVGHRSIRGSAVVCDIAKVDNTVRYGVLYIDINPSLEKLFSLKSLSSTWVKELAVTLADNALINKNLSRDDQELQKAQSLLFDAVETFRDRLCLRLKNKVDTQGNPYQLADLFEFSAEMLSVTVPIRNEDGSSVSRQTIRPVLELNQQVHFKMDSGRKFPTLMEFLQELSETFELLLAKK